MKWIKKIGLIIIKSLTVFLALIGVLYLVFIFGPYDNVKSKTVAPPSTEDFSNIDVSRFENSESAEYFFMVKAYADYMITHGRDRYGTEHSPLFATTLNRKTGNVYRKNPPEAPKGIRDRDRTCRGANVSKDNGLYSILYSLSELTGDPRYAEEVDKTIKWFFENCQNSKTGKEVFLTAIETVLNYYERNTTDKGAILYASDYPEHYSLAQSMNLATNLYRAMELLPGGLAKRMKKLADGTDSVYLSFDHEPSADGIGFLKSAHLFTLEPGEFRSAHLGKNPWSKMWTAGYGAGGSVSQANSCFARYKQTGIEEYKNLFLKSAEAYYSQDVPKAEVLYPGNYSSLFDMMRTAYGLTGEERFLNEAKTYINLAVEAVMDDESPLPKASNKSQHYEAITGGPGFMGNLLSYWKYLNDQGNIDEAELDMSRDGGH